MLLSGELSAWLSLLSCCEYSFFVRRDARAAPCFPCRLQPVFLLELPWWDVRDANVALPAPNSVQRPVVNFKSFKVTVHREASVVAPNLTTFQVTCPDGCGSGDQISVMSPVNGSRLIVQVPDGIKGGMAFSVSAPGAAPQTPSPQQLPAGTAVGQVVSIDTDGDGINDTYGVAHDTDGDGIPDAVAVDYNNDGIIDQYFPVTQPGGQSTTLRVMFDGSDRLQVTASVRGHHTLCILTAKLTVPSCSGAVFHRPVQR